MGRSALPPKKEDGKLMAGRRKTRAERVIARDITRGLSRSEIENNLSENKYELGYKYTPRTAEQMVRDVYNKMLQAYSNETMKKYKPLLYNHLIDIYREARESKNLNVALKTLREIGLMSGAYDQVDATVQTNNIVSINFGFDEPSVENVQEIPYVDKNMNMINDAG